LGLKWIIFLIDKCFISIGKYSEHLNTRLAQFSDPYFINNMCNSYCNSQAGID
jgi:hypothetical protein